MCPLVCHLLSSSIPLILLLGLGISFLYLDMTLDNNLVCPFVCQLSIIRIPIILHLSLGLEDIYLAMILNKTISVSFVCHLSIGSIPLILPLSKTVIYLDMLMELLACPLLYQFPIASIPLFFFILPWSLVCQLLSIYISLILHGHGTFSVPFGVSIVNCIYN